MGLAIVCRRGACSPSFTSSTPSEYENPFFRKLDNQRYWLLKLDVHRERASRLRAANGADAVGVDVLASFESLRVLVSTISRGEALASTGDFDELLNQAAEHRGTPTDITEWADRLANDVGEIDD